MDGMDFCDVDSADVHGSFESVSLAIRPRLEVASEWLIAADKVSYRIQQNGVIVLTVVPCALKPTVKIETPTTAASEDDLTASTTSGEATLQLGSLEVATAPTASGKDASRIKAKKPAIRLRNRPVSGNLSVRGRVLCCVKDCKIEAYRRVFEDDAFGKYGPRCRKHGALGKRTRETATGPGGKAGAAQKSWPHPRKPLNPNPVPADVGGCSTLGSENGEVGPSEVLAVAAAPDTSDGARVKSGRHCNVAGCVALARRQIPQPDQFAEAGPRCMGHGAVSQRCTVSQCAKKAISSVLESDMHGPCGLRCRTHSERAVRALPLRPDSCFCQVNSCPKVTHSSVSKSDAFGSAGPRCVNHGGEACRCTVPGCMLDPFANVDESDCFGPAGARCENHAKVRIPGSEKCKRSAGSRRSRECVVASCSKRSLGNVQKSDQYGMAGQRCMRHGGVTPRCAVLGCTGKALNPGVAPAARRCKGHVSSSPQRPHRRTFQGPVARQCSVAGCVKKSVAKVAKTDQFGPAGGRCMVHGGASLRCSVRGCIGKALSVGGDDEFGPPGHRCKIHLRPSANEGGEPCNVAGCFQAARGKVAEQDEFGLPGTRCLAHGVHSWRCTVVGCTNTARVESEYGPGSRCYKHRSYRARAAADGRAPSVSCR